MADVCKDGQETRVMNVSLGTMVPTVTDVAQTVMYLEVVIGQVGSVKEAVNVDGEETLVIKHALLEVLDLTV